MTRVRGRHFGRQTPADALVPAAGRRPAPAASLVLVVVGVSLVLVAVGMWGYAQWQYSRQDAEDAKLASYATVSDGGDAAPTVDWGSLEAVDQDVVGWIQIPGTVVNYPVYQGSDNDYYLNTNAEGVYGVGGQIFMDYENAAPGMIDQQTIVYGHHLRNGTMFKPVSDMSDQAFFDSVPTVWYVTETASYELEPLFVYYTNPDDTNVRRFDFGSDVAFHAYLAALLGSSVSSSADAAAAVGGVSHVLTLSTCNYVEGYGRTILVCAEKSEVAAALGPTSTFAA